MSCAERNGDGHLVPSESGFRRELSSSDGRTSRRYSIQYPKWLKNSGFKEARVSRPLAVFFSFVGGYVEAVAYKTLFSLFVGPMSGNTVVLAYQTSETSYEEALTRGATIGTFIIGVLIFSVIREILNRYKIDNVGPVMFFLQFLCLLTFFLLGTFIVKDDKRTQTGWGFYVLMVPAVMSCAVQTGALQRVSSHSVSSTIVTGTITKATTEFVSYLANLYDNYRGNLQDKNKINFHRDGTILYFGLWITYFIGALMGSYAVKSLDLYSLIPIMGILLLLIFGDVIHKFCERVNKIAEVGNGVFEITEAESNMNSRGSTALSGYQPPELSIPYEH